MPSDEESDEPISRRRPNRRDDDDEYDRPRRRHRPSEVEASDFLIPTNVSGYSIAACYFGLISCFLPIIGFIFALIAVVSGIVALRRRKKRRNSYGAITSDIRAMIGLVLGGLTLLFHVGFAIFIVAGAAAK